MRAHTHIGKHALLRQHRQKGERNGKMKEKSKDKRESHKWDNSMGMAGGSRSRRGLNGNGKNTIKIKLKKENLQNNNFPVFQKLI